MKLTSIDLAPFERNLSGTLKRLGKLVVLAGPNGAGKSRILDSVEERLNPWLRLRDSVGFGGDELADEIAKATVVADYVDERVFRPFPRDYKLSDHRNESEHAQTETTDTLRSEITKDLSRSATSYINTVARAYKLSLVPGVRDSTAVEARDRWQSLNGIISVLIGEEMGFTERAAATLFGKEIPDALLSQGQAALLQIAVRIHVHAGLLDGHVLLIDEPETHLHPSVLVDIVDRLLNLDAVGQIWIATHSIPLLAALPTDSLWFVHEGRVSYAGKEPEKVLNGLLGGDEGRANIEEFLRLPTQVASNRFAAECLLPPQVADTGAGDPQAKQLRDFLALKGASPRILDYGAGQGRLLVALHEWGQPSEESPTTIDYHAFDTHPGSELEGRVVDLCDNHTRVHTSTDELRALTKASFDVVIMCNVLHELLPDVWKDAFGPDGHVTRLLKPTGHLLVLEDMEIPAGEKAHDYGFLLLDKLQLCALFQLSSESGAIETFKARNGRLKAHAIAADSLGNVTHQTVCDALGELQRSSLDAAKAILKKKEKSSESGRLYALRCQSHMNATLALKALS